MKKAILISYTLKKELPTTDRVKLMRKLHTHVSSSNNSKYTYKVPGLIDSIHHIKLSKGVYIIRTEDFVLLRRELRGKADVYAREVTMKPSDKSILYP